MTDFSRLKTIDELDYQTERFERRAEIQWGRLDQRIQWIAHQIKMVTQVAETFYSPIQSLSKKYGKGVNLIWLVVKQIFRLFRKK